MKNRLLSVTFSFLEGDVKMSPEQKGTRYWVRDVEDRVIGTGMLARRHSMSKKRAAYLLNSHLERTNTRKQ